MQGWILLGFHKSRNYTVKYGYWVMVNLLKDDLEEKTMTQPSLESIYQSIWEADVSPKIQHFLWNCLNDCLREDLSLDISPKMESVVDVNPGRNM